MGHLGTVSRRDLSDRKVGADYFKATPEEFLEMLGAFAFAAALLPRVRTRNAR
jgi:hypothetical protein